jgi:hypothetical protein
MYCSGPEFGLGRGLPERPYALVPDFPPIEEAPVITAAERDALSGLGG